MKNIKLDYLFYNTFSNCNISIIHCRETLKLVDHFDVEKSRVQKNSQTFARALYSGVPKVLQQIENTTTLAHYTLSQFCLLFDQYHTIFIDIQKFILSLPFNWNHVEKTRCHLHCVLKPLASKKRDVICIVCWNHWHFQRCYEGWSNCPSSKCPQIIYRSSH